MTNWTDKFSVLFPEEAADTEGAWQWQELNTLYDLHKGQRVDRRRMEIDWWVEQRDRYSKRNDPFSVATVRRCNRMITVLIRHQMESA